MLKRITSTIVFILILGIFSFSSITLNSGGASSDTDISSTTLTFAHTVGAGSNRISIVGVGLEDSATCPTVTGITFNTTENFTQIDTHLFASDANRIDLWYLLNPTVTTANIVITVSDTTDDLNGGAITIDGAKQQAPEADNKGTGAGDSSLVITTLTNGAWIIDIVADASSGTTFTPASGQTERYNVNQGMTLDCGTEEIAIAGEQTAEWTNTGGAWTSIIASFEQYVAPSAYVPKVIIIR